MERIIKIDDIKKTAELFLHLDDTNVIDIVMATYVANRLDADPLWLFVVGPASSAKTEIISSLDGHHNIFLLSSLTPKTFISGKISDSNKQNRCSLLYRINHKILLMKDFTTVLQMRKDHKGEIFSQLREIYDGRYAKAFGTGEAIDWRGKVGLIAGVTPAIDKMMAVNQLLGERFLYLRIHTNNYTRTARKALDRTSGTDAYRKAFQQIVSAMLVELDSTPPDVAVDCGQFKESLVNLATLATHARTAVLRNRFNQTVESMPEPEGPARMAKQLNLLAKALAIVRGQDKVDQAIYEIVKGVARDSLPQLKLKLLDSLWQMSIEAFRSDGKQCWFSTRDIAEYTKMPMTTVRLLCEDLMMLNLIVRTKGAGRNADLWQPSNKLVEWANNSQFFLTNNTYLKKD
jgi:hypothetical protein